MHLETNTIDIFDIDNNKYKIHLKKTKLKIAAQKHDEDNRNHNGFMSVVSSFVDKSFAGNSLYLRGLGLYML